MKLYGIALIVVGAAFSVYTLITEDVFSGKPNMNINVGVLLCTAGIFFYLQRRDP